MIRIQISQHKKLLAVFAVVVLVAAIGTAIKVSTKSSADNLPTPQKAVESHLSFNAADAPKWQQGPHNATSIALFDKNNDCFVAFDVRSGSVDENAELQKVKSSLTADGYAVTDIGTPTLTLRHADTKKDYVVHQYSVASTSADGPYKSQEFAYIPVAAGHIFIQGYCDDPANLPGTLAALSAVTYKP